MTLRIAALILATASIAFAGPTDPPAGPIDSTYKTIDQVEPRTPINAENTPGNFDSTYRISQPGSYYLTEDLIGEDNKHGIEIAANNVSIDLMGFNVFSPPSALTLIGIQGDGTITNISIKNGTVEGWDADGIVLVQGVTTENIRLDNIQSINNAVDGIRVGEYATLTNCSAINNGSKGIVTLDYARISDCVTTGSASDGFDIGRYSTITNCTADNNTKNGFSNEMPSMFTQCYAMHNGQSGFHTLIGATSGGGAITDCQSIENANGIIVFAATVRGCLCNSNTGFGIQMIGNGGRIESNTCSKNDIGIFNASSLNLTTRNFCSLNSTADFDISAFGASAPVTNSAATAGPWDNIDTTPVANSAATAGPRNNLE
jgi:hypothetical protein